MQSRFGATEHHAAGREAGVLSVVIPALNEEAGIAEIVGRIQAVKEQLRSIGIRETEILVVDDGSGDRTSEIVEGLKGVRLIRHGTNRGYGAAIKTGFSFAKGDLLAFLDADGTYPPENLPVLCQAALSNDADIVVGSRRSGGESSMPPMRRLGNLIWSNLVSVLGETKCVDPASGMRILRRSSLPALYPLPDGLNFTPVMSTRAMHEDLKVIEIAIPYSERLGRSKLSIVRDGLRFLKTIIWTALEYNPAKILGIMGLTLLSIAICLGAALTIARASGIRTLNAEGAFIVYATLVCAVSGLSIYSLGVTFNYIIARFHGRPLRGGLFRGLALEKWIEPCFGWAGAASIIVGFTMIGVSMIVGRTQWEITRIWLWLLGSALFVLVGAQLAILWVVARVMDKLAARPQMIDQDLGEAPARKPGKTFGAVAGTH